MRFVTDLSKGILGEPDSNELWAEIIGHIPDSVLLKKNLKILNLAFGYGTEADLIVKRMAGLGVDYDTINNSIWLLDKYHAFSNRAKRKGYKNVITADFLDYKFKGKFDIVIGNPPYQIKNQSFWQVFTKKAISLTKNKGYVAFITPSSWSNGSHLNTPRNIFNTVFQSNKVLAINTDINDYFYKIGKNISYWVLQKTMPDTDKTKIIWNKNQSVDVNLRRYPFMINVFTSHGLSIFEKILDHNQFWDEFVEGPTDLDRVFAFPKIRFNAGYKFGYRYDTVSNNFPTSRAVISLDCTKFSLKEIQNLNELFSKKLYKFLWLIYGANDAGSFGWILRSMPKVNLSKSWTDKKLYAEFNLTPEEINFVEITIK